MCYDLASFASLASIFYFYHHVSLSLVARFRRIDYTYYLTSRAPILYYLTGMLTTLNRRVQYWTVC